MLNGRFEKPMTTAQGLFSNTVFSMANADDGSLWIGSYGGVTRLKSPGR